MKYDHFNGHWWVVVADKWIKNDAFIFLRPRIVLLNYITWWCVIANLNSDMNKQNTYSSNKSTKHMRMGTNSFHTKEGRSSSCHGPFGSGWWWWSKAQHPDGESCWAVWEPTDYFSLPFAPFTRRINKHLLSQQWSAIRDFIT